MKINAGMKLFYLCTMIVCGFIFLITPSMGENILKYEIWNAVALLLFCTALWFPYVATGISLLKTKLEPALADEEDVILQNEFSEKTTFQKTISVLGIILGFLFGLCIFVVSISNFKNIYQDYQNGPITITLTETNAPTRTSARHTYNPFSSGFYYRLTGREGLESYYFNIPSADMTPVQAEAISKNHPTITITYYPITKSIVSIEVLFSDGSGFTLPKEAESSAPSAQEEAVENDRTDNTASSENSNTSDIQYIEYSSDSIDILGIHVGDNITEASDALSAAGYEVKPSDSVESELSQSITESHALPESSDFVIAFSQSQQIVLIYDCETGTITEIISRTPAPIQYNP